MMSTWLRILALLPLVGLSACGALSGGADEGPVTVVIATTEWGEDGAQEPETTEVEASKGDTVTLGTGRDTVEVTFTSVRPDEVELETSEDMAPEGKTGGINLTDTRSDFTVTSDRRLKFSTPTTDSGTTWVVTIGR